MSLNYFNRSTRYTIAQKLSIFSYLIQFSNFIQEEYNILTSSVGKPQPVRIPFPINVVIGLDDPRIVLKGYGKHKQQIEQVGYSQSSQICAGGALHRFSGEYDHGQHVTHHAHGYNSWQKCLLRPKVHCFPEVTVLLVLND